MKMFLFFCVIVLGCTVASFSLWDSGTKTGVIYFTVSDGITEVDPKALSEILQSELVKKKAFLVVERSQIQKIMDEKKLELAGLTESETATRLGSLLGADKIITGSISKLGKNYYIIIKGINTKDGVVEYSEEGTSETLEALPDVLHEMADRLAGEATGSSAVSSSKVESGTITGNNIDKLQQMVLNRQFLKSDKIPEMQNYSGQVPLSVRDLIYQKYDSGWGWPLVGDVFIPSLGSYLQGDYLGGTITLVGFYG